MLNRAFSLIELMVVIAIVGVLAAVAVPSYKTYIAKARIANGAGFADGLKNYVQQLYDINGSIPAGAFVPPGTTTVTYQGSSWVAVNSADVMQYQYYGTTTLSTPSVFIHVMPAQGVFPGQNVYTPTSGNANFIILEGQVINGIWTWTCGGYNNVAGEQIPVIYMPGNCQTMIQVT